MAEHEFGGGWTSIKLELLERYLQAWVQVMSKQSFLRLYIDAFAGTGKCTPKGQVLEIDGSAIRALDCDGIDEYYFFEQKLKHVNELNALCASTEYANKNTTVTRGDANQLVQDIIRKHTWNNARAVLFLDPYGMEVEWQTLESIANTGAIDLWYLFSISGLFRNAAHKFEALEKSKEAAITRCLGTDEWKDAFYEPLDQGDLFSSEPEMRRSSDVSDLERYVQERLETIFPMVLPPRRLTTAEKNVPLFSLFFAVSNKSDKAQGIAKNIANHLLTNF